MQLRPLLLTLVTVCALGCATPLLSSDWLRVKTPHFELVTSAGKKRSVEIAQELELFRATLEVVAPVADLEPRVPLVVYVFGDSEEFARFQTRPGLDTFLIQRPHRSFLVIDASRRDSARPSVYHEYVHFLLRNGSDVRYPTWYDEGFAEFLSTLTVDDERVLIGGVPPDRDRWLVYGGLLSLRRLMLARDVDAWSDAARARFFAQSWALTHFLYAGHKLGYPERYQQIGTYLVLLDQGLLPEEACVQAFGTSYEGIEQDLLRYVAEGEMPKFAISRERLSVPEDWSAAELRTPEAQRLLGELALALGDDWLGEAEQRLRQSVEAEPEQGATHAALAQIMARRGEPGADAHMSRALTLAEEDSEVHWRSAESLLERAAHESDDRSAIRLGERARHHFRRSIALAPDQVASYAGLGRVHLVVPGLSDPEEGLEWLRAAHRHLPGDRSIALWLAELELQLGQVDTARQRLASLPIRPHGDPASRAERDELLWAEELAGLYDVAARSRHFLESRLDVDTPEPETRVTELAPWVEVAGRAGLWETKLHDVVIAIDRSVGALLPTGIDLDGDGRVGETQRKGTLWNGSDESSDPGDAIIRAEVEAARALIRQLDPRSVRVAVVTFADEATVLAPLGTPEAALDALDAEVVIDSSGTSLARALSTSLEVLVDERDLNARRQRTVLLLSDGQPTLPTVPEGRRDAIELAEQMGEFGVRIHAFALGESAVEGSDFYRELANRSRGDFVPVGNPAEVVSELADVRFTGLEEVSIFNRTSNAPARVVRVFPDGTFDGYAPLEEGENELEITAYVDGLPPLREKRTVFFARPSQVEEKQRQAAKALLLQIEYRTAELELLDEIRGSRGVRQRRGLDVEREADGGG